MKKGIIIFLMIMILLTIFIVIKKQPTIKAQELRCSECGSKIFDGNIFLGYYDENSDTDIILCFGCISDNIGYAKMDNPDREWDYYCINCKKNIKSANREYTSFIFSVDNIGKYATLYDNHDKVVNADNYYLEDFEFSICDDCLYDILYEAKE